MTDLYNKEIFKLKVSARLPQSDAITDLGIVGSNKFDLESLFRPVARLLTIHVQQTDDRPENEIREEIIEYFETHAHLMKRYKNQSLSFKSYYSTGEEPDLYIIKTLDINFGSKIGSDDVEALINL